MRGLREVCPDSVHVETLRLRGADDSKVWEAARVGRFAILELAALCLMLGTAAASAQTVLASATWPQNGHVYLLMEVQPTSDRAWAAADSGVTALLGPQYRPTLHLHRNASRPPERARGGGTTTRLVDSP